jgi:hypothetical protein
MSAEPRLFASCCTELLRPKTTQCLILARIHVADREACSALDYEIYTASVHRLARAAARHHLKTLAASRQLYQQRDESPDMLQQDLHTLEERELVRNRNRGCTVKFLWRASVQSRSADLFQLVLNCP